MTKQKQNENRLASPAQCRIVAGMIQRFVTRPDREGFCVYDIWTGEIAVIAMVPQEQLSEVDAQHTAALLNRRAQGGDRSLAQ